jgi:hypothetical protein
MTTATKPDTAAVETPELTAGERLAADLRVLADIAATTPPVAAELARTFEEVHVVLRMSGPGQDVLAAALIERSAEETPPTADRFGKTCNWMLPNRAITVRAWSVAVDVDDIEAAGR